MGGNRVRELRVERGIPGTVMAEYLGVSVPVYYKKETGAIVWTLENAKAISDYFGRTIEEIFFAS